MKKVIDGRIYNTETAQFLCSHSYSNHSDFHYCDEELYRTKKGQYFIYGEGGSLSKYARTCGLNEWCGGEDIELVTENEAKRFVESYGTAEEYAVAFGEPEEG